MPPRYRLACQCFVRNEDILVSSRATRRLPAKPPGLSRAAKIYKGGIQHASVEEFLGYAVKVEEDAAIHFDELSDSDGKVGNDAVASLFAQLAAFSRLHLAEAQKRAGAVDARSADPARLRLAGPCHAGTHLVVGGRPAMSRLDALRAALSAKSAAIEFYYTVPGTSTDAEVVAMAKEFVREEAEHVKFWKPGSPARSGRSRIGPPDHRLPGRVIVARPGRPTRDQATMRWPRRRLDEILLRRNAKQRDQLILRHRPFHPFRMGAKPGQQRWQVRLGTLYPRSASRNDAEPECLPSMIRRWRPKIIGSSAS